jgi:hypothetical protein
MAAYQGPRSENEGLVRVSEIDSNFAFRPFNLGRGGGGLPALFTKCQYTTAVFIENCREKVLALW